MKNYITLVLIFVVSLGLYSCEDLVNDVDEQIDQVSDGQLNQESQVPFLITGVQTRFGTTYDRLAVQSGGLSDEQIFDTRVPNATFPTFRQIDQGQIELDNNSVDGVYNDVGELRLFADSLVNRVSAIEFDDAALQQEAQFVGSFYGGIARYFLATYFGLNPTEGGGVIDGGPFIPSSEMYDLALTKLNDAVNQAPSAYDARVVNTLIARIQLIRGNYPGAETTLDNALVSGDDPFLELHSVESSNEWWANAGRGRTQFVTDFFYSDLVEDEPQEGNRVVLTSKAGNDGDEDEGIEPTTFYFQDLYPQNSSPLPFTNWQEADLMRAEIAIRNSDPITARGLIDDVRASHNIDPLPLTETVDLDLLELERRKELYTLGLRLVDQRRFDTFHLPDGSWEYLPITQSERNQNPNID